MSTVPSTVPSRAPVTIANYAKPSKTAQRQPVQIHNKSKPSATAIIYCEANFGEIDGKTANGLIQHSEKYEILSIIDSKKAGQDTGSMLDDEPNNIPISRDLTDSLAQIDSVPDYFIFGMAPSSGMLSKHQRTIILEAYELRDEHC